jgi:predicted nucleic acid-binding protein
METNPADRPVSVERVVAVLSELSLDLMNAVRSAIPYTLREQLAGTLEDERIADLADAILAETAARFKVSAGATLLASRAGFFASPPSPKRVPQPLRRRRAKRVPRGDEERPNT